MQCSATHRQLLLLGGHGIGCHGQALQLLLQLQHGQVVVACLRRLGVEHVGHGLQGCKAVVAACTARARGAIGANGGGWIRRKTLVVCLKAVQ